MKKENLLKVLFVAAIAVAILLYFIRGYVSWVLLPIVPLLYGALTQKWVELGFTRKNMVRGLVAGVAVGVVIGAARYGLIYLTSDWWLTPNYDVEGAHEYYNMVFGKVYLAPFLILLFIPITTFQEIFYRGYLQVQFAGKLKPLIKSKAVRVTLAIGLSSLLYALWLAPALGTMAILLFFSSCTAGYLFHRYGNIMAPNAVIAVEFMFVIYFMVRSGLV